MKKRNGQPSMEWESRVSVFVCTMHTVVCEWPSHSRVWSHLLRFLQLTFILVAGHTERKTGKKARTWHGVKSIHSHYIVHIMHIIHDGRQNRAGWTLAKKKYKYVVHDTRSWKRRKAMAHTGEREKREQTQKNYPCNNASHIEWTMTSCICACNVFRSGNKIVHNETMRWSAHEPTKKNGLSTRRNNLNDPITFCWSSSSSSSSVFHSRILYVPWMSIT